MESGQAFHVHGRARSSAGHPAGCAWWPSVYTCLQGLWRWPAWHCLGERREDAPKAGEREAVEDLTRGPCALREM